MAESLYLNKKKVDIYAETITRKIQIGDIGDIGARKSSFSYTIKIPRTSRNKLVFDMLGVSGNTSRKPYEEVAADYVVDGVYLVTNGIAIIRETGKDYSVNIIDGIRGLSDLLQGKKLEDLPLEDLNHTLTTQNYIDSFQNTEGFIYGIADYGQGASSSLKVERQAPSIYSHTLFRRIFEASGLSLQGEFFTTNKKFLSEVVTPSKGYTVEDVYFSSSSKGGHGSNTLLKYRSSNDFISVNEKFTLTNNSLVGASILNGEILFSVAGTYKLDVSVLYNVFKTYATVRFKINGSIKSSIYLNENDNQADRSLTFSVESGDVISFDISATSSYFYDEVEEDFFRYTLNYSASVTGSLYLLAGGQVIKPIDYIGDMNQIDFIKDVANRYGLLLHPIQNTNEFRFKRIEALLSDTETAEDWTDKFVSLDKENYVSGYAKINRAGFKYPQETVIPTNNGKIEIDNENANQEKTIFTSPFEIPLKAGNIGGFQAYLIPIWNAAVENLETPLKIMNIERFDTSITAKLFAEVTGITVTESVPFLSLAYIDMQYFLNVFYRNFKGLIENYKKVSLEMNLSVIDIFNADFFKLKYLKQTGRFYYMTSIQNRKGKNSNVEAIEIKEFLGNQPPSQIGDFSFNMQRLATRTITLANLKTGYEDPELDEPLKIKIISGFNSNVLLKQNGVTITSETEINAEDLALTAVETVGGVTDYVEQWVFNISDKGSGQYSEDTGLIIANVLEYTNNPPVANAGEDFSYDLISPFVYYPALSYIVLNGSASYDNTGEIISYFWEIISKPVSGSATFSNANSQITNLQVNNDEENVGQWVIRLTVTDEFGATDTDEVTITINLDFAPE